MTPWDVANLDLRGMFGRIKVEDHQTLLHTKSVSSDPHGFREEDFKGSLATRFYIKLWPLGCGQLGPQGLDCQDLSRGPLHTATY